MLLLAVAFVASYIPSRRALRVDPISALLIAGYDGVVSVEHEDP